LIVHDRIASQQHADAAPALRQPVVAANDESDLVKFTRATVAHVWRGTNGRGAAPCPSWLVKCVCRRRLRCAKLTAIVIAPIEALRDSAIFGLD